MGYTGTPPDYQGGSLVNLMAELERRLTGASPSPGLHPHLADLIPDASTYVFVLFDGLGAGQLSHPAASALRDDHVATIDSPFPATTTVALATVATGLPASQHGLVGYQMWLPEAAQVANTIHWTTLWGDDLGYDTRNLLPSPNLPERLRAAGKEPITVQPLHFEYSHLTKALYRGCRFEGIQATEDLVEVPLRLASIEGRVIFLYVPHVDFAAHVSGQKSDDYAIALTAATDVWERLTYGLPDGVIMVGTADHGHIDFPQDRQIQIAVEHHEGRHFAGDSRAMFVYGDGGAELAAAYPATWVPIDEMIEWWGPGPQHPQFSERIPTGALVADDGYLLLHRFSDRRLVGNHGALHPAEQEIPLLVAGG